MPLHTYLYPPKGDGVGAKSKPLRSLGLNEAGEVCEGLSYQGSAGRARFRAFPESPGSRFQGGTRWLSSLI